MKQRTRHTLRAHAALLSAIGKDLARLASEHRRVASEGERSARNRTNSEESFADWIRESARLAAAAEWMLALEVELAAQSGVTWAAIGEILGVTRQAAHERFGSQERWRKGRRFAQNDRAWWAKVISDYRNNHEIDDETLQLLQRRFVYISSSVEARPIEPLPDLPSTGGAPGPGDTRPG